jgi:hypothetical protein
MRRMLISLLVAFGLAGCGSPTTPTPPAITPAPATPTPLAVTPAPSQVACVQVCPTSSSTDGNYRLELVLPHLVWKAGDAISGSADLGLTDGLPAKVAGASELIAFAFDQVGGNRHVAPSWLQSCVVYPLDPASPTNVALYKSGGFTGTEPDADFLRSFFADPQIRLPIGTWDITAIAAFSEGGCSGLEHTIKTTLRVTVTG